MKKYFFPALLLFIYSLFLIKVMVFKDLSLIRIGHIFLNFGGTHEGSPNFIPFKTILPYLFGYKGLIIAGINIIGNIILLFPIGLIIPFLIPSNNWRQLLFIAFFSGFIIEGLQVILHVGIFDIDDVILNGLGVMMGYWTFLILSKSTKALKYGLTTTLVLFFISVIAYSTVYYFQNNQFPFEIGASEEKMQSQLRNTGNHTFKNNCQNCDLCGGTGGIGYVLSIEMITNTINLKRNDSTLLNVKCTNQTIIKASTGNISISDIKTGDRLTLIGDANNDNSFLASNILVCSNSPFLP